MPHLAPIRALLNPHFEGYKLSFSPSPNLQQFSLPQPVNQARSGLSSLGFQKVASRVRHNHLGVGDDIAVYISENGGVFAVDANDDSSPIRQVFQLPEFVSDPKRTQGEYPSAAHISSNLWFIADGHGGANLVRIPKDGPAELLSTFEHVVDDDTIPTPFQLHSVAVIDHETAVTLVSTTVPHVQLPETKHKDQPLFDIWGLRFPLSNTKPVDLAEKPLPMVPLFRRRGTHIPFYSTYFPTIHSFLILSGSAYTNINTLPPEEYIPSPDEYAPIPRLGDIDEGSFDLNSSSSSTSIPPPYSWTQTNDSVTVAFALPGTTTKECIRVLFGRGTISLTAGHPPLPQPFYNNAPLWDSIDVGSSLWTWERPPDLDGTVGHPKAGLLTLHLEKANQGTRWSSLFAQGFEHAEIPETIDPSELAHIRDMLDKYTATIRDGGGGADLGHGVPSLVEGELDVSVDEVVGRRAFCTWVGVNEGFTPEPLTDDIPATILSVPIPVSGSEKENLEMPFTLIAKHDIDGALFTCETSPDLEKTLLPSWTHTQTYSALSFVLASKQDTRFTYHYQQPQEPSNGTSSNPPQRDGVVFAFESGSRSSGSANVYTYRSSKRGDKQTRQGVFQMRPGSGALVGAGVVHLNKGEPVLICLSPWLPNSTDFVNEKARKETAQAIHEACVNYGFFYLDISSYVNITETDELVRLAREFFALPQEEKDLLSLRNEDHARGYARLNENVTAGKADNHEGLDFYRPVENTDKTKPLWGNNQWPTVEGFREKYEVWVDKMKVLGCIVMGAMAEGLGLTTEEWESLRSQVDDSFWVMRVIGYPPLPDDHDGISCGAHKFLYADPTPGALQVYLRKLPNNTNNIDDGYAEKGKWINADPIQGCVVCNIGESYYMPNLLMKKNDADNLRKWNVLQGLVSFPVRFVRVKLGSVLILVLRCRIPFFFEPNFDAFIDPLPSAIALARHIIKPTESVGGGKRSGKTYKPVMYGEFLMKKVGNNFSSSGSGKYA
ncbi:hypothetical protein Clacol_010037 [Clathrus columnatus]|uniref:NudC domain-containing protein 1 n=1 Tax=Clathrus columnatus TaxID=1419009 RepID=A0AAV5ASN8_9AGAM|nr:hypothetical protein Clacol_010037 [Clathrus columnatus]